MNCNHCNRYITTDSEYCPYCGTKNDIPKIERNKFSISADISLKSILLAIAIGVWILVLQNFGIIPISQNVNVTNDVEIEGDVRVNNTVDVSVVDY